ncbi:MAG: ABC transporter permease [Oscillospiraceae bacterium]
MNTIAVRQNGIQSKFMRELNAIVTITMREITLFFKSPGSLVMSFAMPLVMMGMLGGSLKQNMAGGLGFGYGKYMLVGMLVNMLFMTTTSGLTSLVEDRATDFTQEMMISPISRYAIVVGKIIGTSFGAIIGMLGTLLTGFFMGITLTVGQMLAVLALSPLICLSAGALAMIVIGLIKNNKVANMAVMILVMPQMFLSGAIIPVTNSSGVLFMLSRMMPMTYCLDLVRSVVYSGTSEYSSVVLFNPAVNLAAILSLTVICLCIGTMFFAKSEKSK